MAAYVAHTTKKSTLFECQCVLHGSTKGTLFLCLQLETGSPFYDGQLSPKRLVNDE